MNKYTRGTTQLMMMLEANRQIKSTSSCMDALDSCTKNHGFTTIKRFMRKSSSVILNEAICGRQPHLFIHLYKPWQVYIMFFIWKLQVTSYHCSNKCHNHILYALIGIEWELCYLIFGKLVDHFFLCLLVFRVFLIVSLERNMKYDPFWF
jgi:hypothetical protein